MFRRIICLLLLLVLALVIDEGASASDPVSEAVGKGTVGEVLVGPIVQGVDQIMKKAEESGDYLMLRAAQSIKDALDLWKKTNKELLDDAYDKVDSQRFATVSGLKGLIGQIDQGLGDHITQANDLVVKSGQIVAELPLSKRQTYVLTFAPRIAPPTAVDNFQVRLQGVRLDQGDPRLFVDGKAASRILPGPTEVQFTVPVASLKRKPHELSVHRLPMTYTSPPESWWKGIFNNRETLTREIPVITLPQQLGDYALTYRRKIKREAKEEVVTDYQQSKKKNDNDERVFPPPQLQGHNDWQWKLDTVRFDQGEGKAGRCEKIVDYKTSPNGVVVQYRLDEVRQGLDWGPGHVNCRVVGTIVRTYDDEVDGVRKEGSLGWTDAVTISHEEDAISSSIELVLRTFDKQTLLAKADLHHKYFEVTHHQRGFVVTPKVPRDIIE
ncbi:MAG: hypothetical protein KF747_16430 [Nitrospira sp.]|nr:hypothetical protein [Nitrospira sp.]